MILGYLLAVVAGFLLGLIGGGGSILIVPVLVYTIHIPPVLATSYSLFIVGVSALIGAVQYGRRGQVELRTAFLFGVPSIATIFIARRWILPAIPDVVNIFGWLEIEKGLLIMLLFASLMVLAAISMIRRNVPASFTFTTATNKGWEIFIIGVQGATIGLLMGPVGAGGGFLIIPVLVLLGGLEIHRAVGTSLIIIAANSLIGFMADVSKQPIDWSFLALFTLLSFIGVLIGTVASHHINGARLRPAFGWFVLVMSAYIFLRELL